MATMRAAAARPVSSNRPGEQPPDGDAVTELPVAAAESSTAIESRDGLLPGMPGCAAAGGVGLCAVS